MERSHSDMKNLNGVESCREMMAMRERDKRRTARTLEGLDVDAVMDILLKYNAQHKRGDDNYDNELNTYLNQVALKLIKEEGKKKIPQRMMNEYVDRKKRAKKAKTKRKCGCK